MCIPFKLQVIDLIQSLRLQLNLDLFLMVFSIALVITSIRVISRMMHDLEFLDRVAVIEDLVCMWCVAIAIGYAVNRRTPSSACLLALKHPPAAPAPT